MQQNWWEQYPEAGSAPPVPGRPVYQELPPEPAPVRPVVEQRDQVGLERDRVALERDRLEVEKLRAGTEQQKQSVEQGKAAGFLSRAVRANQLYSGTGVGAPSLGREFAQDILPEGVVNRFTGPARQQAEAAQNDFVAATLRYESGAAIPPEELEAQRRRYFPVAGDSEATIALKAKLRENAIEALRTSAGAAAIDIGSIENETVRSELEQRVARGDSPQDTIKWLIAIGRTPTPDEVDRIFANAGNTDPRVLPPQQQGEDLGHAFGVGVRGVVEGAGDMLGIVSDPFIQGVNAVTGSNLNPDFGGNLADMMGLPHPQSDAERLAFEASRFGTGALGAAGAARQAARYVPGVVGGALERFGGMPLTDTVSGAAGGASGEVARQQGAGPVGQAAATFAGGASVLPFAARTATSRAVDALTGGPDVPPPPVVRAGQEEGVDVSRAMADRSVEPKVVARGKTMVGAHLMGRQQGKIADQIEGRVQALGQGGDALEAPVAGQVVENAANRYIKNSGQRLGKIYDNLERQVGDVKVPPTNALAQVDEAIARLSELGNTNSAELQFLQGLRNDLSKDLSVASLRRLRTSLRQKISRGDLTFGEDEARVLSIMDAAADDIASGLAAQGKAGAAAAFKRVDNEYRARMDFIQNTVQRIVGRRNAHLPPEKIIANLRAMALPKGDGAGFARMFRELNPEEQRDIAATFVDALGKNADGEFSTTFLVKHIERIPQGIRSVVFGPEGAKSLANLEMLAREHKRVTRALGGSPTALATDARSWVLNLLFGGGVGIQSGAIEGVAAGAGLAALKAGKDALSARALMSPKITGWLRSIPRTQDPKAINAAWDRLRAIAVREPALAPEVQQLQQMILNALNDNAPQAGRVVASPNEGPQPQE